LAEYERHRFRPKCFRGSELAPASSIQGVF
jgi:hypothetical protein